MAVYTVHEPPMKADQSQPDPERFVFVRDGFSFWAFLLPPLWMLRHRLWLVVTGYMIVVIALQVGLRALGASSTVIAVVSFLIALLVGLEAATLRRFTLSRRGWKNVGIVVGDDLDAVERRFFDAWVDKSPEIEPRRPTAPASTVPILRQPQTSPDVIGLFPEPGASR
jgi:hypothetical protein